LGKELEMKKKYPKLFLDSGLRLKFQRWNFLLEGENVKTRLKTYPEQNKILSNPKITIG
jgi:hypothetical protein